MQFFPQQIGKIFPNLLQIGHHCHANWESTCKNGSVSICIRKCLLCKIKLGNVPNLQNQIGKRSQSAESNWERFSICRIKLGNVPNLQNQIGKHSQSAESNWETFPICRIKLRNVPNLQNQFGKPSQFEALKNPKQQW